MDEGVDRQYAEKVCVAFWLHRVTDWDPKVKKVVFISGLNVKTQTIYWLMSKSGREWAPSFEHIEHIETDLSGKHVPEGLVLCSAYPFQNARRQIDVEEGLRVCASADAIVCVLPFSQFWREIVRNMDRLPPVFVDYGRPPSPEEARLLVDGLDNSEIVAVSYFTPNYVPPRFYFPGDFRKVDTRNIEEVFTSTVRVATKQDIEQVRLDFGLR